MKSPIHILRRLVQRSAERRRRVRFSRAVTHVHGPTALETAPGDVIAIVLVRDGCYYMDAFFDHYRAMGIRHFAFIDNGSTDDTLARIKAQPGTVIDHCPLPLAGYEDLIRAYPANTYGTDRWCLYVDMDEMFDFEGRAAHGIKGLTSYLTAQGHTACVAQMLEMFPKAPLAEVAQMPFPQALEEFVYFDISTVDRFEYHSADIPFAALLQGNTTTNDAIKFCFGGVRGKVFGEACCLTKHPLVFNGAGVTAGVHPHLSMGVTCSDVTGVIKHYKFTNNPVLRDAATMASGAVDHGEDAARAQLMQSRADLTLFSLDARRWNRVELLYRAGFLQGSEAYSAHLEGRKG